MIGRNPSVIPYGTEGQAITGDIDQTAPVGAMQLGARDAAGILRPLRVGDNDQLISDITIVQDIVGVGNIFAFDNYPSGWVTLDGTITDGDTVDITVGGVTEQHIVATGETLEDIAQSLAADLNANGTFAADFEAMSRYTTIFTLARRQGDELDGTGLSTDTSGGATITATPNDSTLKRLFKEVRGETDNEDARVVRLGVFGEVGTRTRAENPVFLSVRKELATGNQTLFMDKTVASLTTDTQISVAFITDVIVADDVGGEFRLYKGLFRDRVEDFVGDGTTKTFTLDYTAVEVESHTVITVEGEEQKNNETDYHIDDCPTNDAKSDIIFKAAPQNGDDIQVTYDACERRILGAFVQPSTSQQVRLGAPLKLVKDSNHYMIGTVSNKSANAAVVIMNILGFFETSRS